ALQKLTHAVSCCDTLTPYFVSKWKREENAGFAKANRLRRFVPHNTYFFVNWVDARLALSGNQGL
ncbi:MAG: hypothetical protein ACUVQR_09495, partial [Thermogutta sp.]